jgi:carboxymethylenebutenolidase
MAEEERMVERMQIKSFDGRTFEALLNIRTRVPAPGIVMIPEMYGLTQPLRETAARFSEQGFVVALVDVFWRFGPSIELGYDKAGSDQARVYHDAFDYALGLKDVQAVVTHLRARVECNGRVGVVGYCLGGTVAYLAAARTDADAAVGYYGTRIQNFLDDAANINHPLMLHFGERDHTTPPEILRQIMPAIAGNDLVTAHVHPEAGHAFANHRRPDRYHGVATERADAQTFGLFRRTLDLVH